MFYIHLFILTVTGAFVHLSAQKTRLTKQRVVEIFLVYFIALYCGIGQLVPGLLHIAVPELMALHTGWPTGNPFQEQLGFAYLTFGVLGILSSRMKGDFRVAAALGCSIFMTGVGAVHVNDLFLHRNFAPGNAGPALAVNTAVPVIVLALLLVHLRLVRRQQAACTGVLEVLPPVTGEAESRIY